jgi:geranylgeranyl diphosphate synthase, type I
MLNKIKSRIETELRNFTKRLDTQFSLHTLSPLLSRHIKEFVSRKGKRIRPVLFCIGYLGYSARQAPGLYASALSIELLHDFMLVHDDIIDKSPTRRNKPSMHAMFERHLRRFRKVKFSGEDLAIVAGDVMYALALHTFLSIEEDGMRKEEALRQLIKAALYTGSGEFIELMAGTRDISKITLDDIFKIYDYKTAHYTFACPMTMGATLAGAPHGDIKKLFDLGIYLGRAFQIKDDILGIYGDERKIGKSTLTDLQEAKKTILIWNTYHLTRGRTRRAVQALLGKKTVSLRDLTEIRRIMRECGALRNTEAQVNRFVEKARVINRSTGMKRDYRVLIDEYCREILSL